MKLKLKILNGHRSKTFFDLNLLNTNAETDGNSKYIYETESIEISFFSPTKLIDIKLLCFEGDLEYSDRIDFPDGYEYIWKPKHNNFALFLNYFGQTNLSLELINLDYSKNTYQFECLDIYTTKSNAEKIRQMIHYLLQENCQDIISPRRITQSPFKLTQGKTPPEILLEKYEQILYEITGLLEKINNQSLYKLTQTKLLTNYKNNHSNIDDNSIAWLLNNVDRLYEVFPNEEAILQMNNTYYSSDLIEVSDSIYDFDIYENRIIIGFLDNMISMANYILANYNDRHTLEETTEHSLYVSFTAYIKKVSYDINERYIQKFEIIKEKLIHIKYRLQKKFSNVKSHAVSPLITGKIRSNYAYLRLFNIIIQWYRLGRVDWGKFDLLISINNIAKLFELYSFFKIKNSLSKILNFTPSLFICDETTSKGFKYDYQEYTITLLYEPIYWMIGHKKSAKNQLYNIEGLSFYNGSIGIRSRLHHFSHRSPDFVITICKGSKKEFLIIDAKYMSTIKMLQVELPKLTLKYLHGLHHDEYAISGLMLLNYGQEQKLYDYFCEEYNLFNSPKHQQILAMTLNEEPTSSETSLLDSTISHFINSSLTY